MIGKKNHRRDIHNGQAEGQISNNEHSQHPGASHRKSGPVLPLGFPSRWDYAEHLAALHMLHTKCYTLKLVSCTWNSFIP